MTLFASIGSQLFLTLNRLILIKQGICQIEGFDKQVGLTEMWLNENEIPQIVGLENCKALRRLFLNNNKITRIEGLEKLCNLETLWLNENQIESLDGIPSLPKLREISIAMNKIEVIGTGLDGLDCLEDLNMSGNKIGNFKELLNLNRLPSLRIATFFDPHYGDNPICNLWNYQTYVLYHLPNLEKLDTLHISDDAKAFAEATFMKKRMYYNMRIKTIQRNASNMLKLIQVGKKLKKFKLDIDVTRLTKKMYATVRELEERQFLSIQKPSVSEGEGDGSQSTQVANPLDLLDQEKLLTDLERKKTLFQGRIHDKNDEIKEIELSYEKLRRMTYELSEQNIHRMMTELETGGNIRFEEGKPADKWFSSCDDLIKSRFDADLMKRKFGIADINILRVTRIHNRFLRNRFEEKIEQLMDLSNSVQK